MAKFSASITIKHPIEEVFAFVTDVDNAARWQTGVIEARATSQGTIGIGETYVYVVQALGKKIETSGEVTVHEPLLIKQGQSQMETDLAKLKKQLER